VQIASRCRPAVAVVLAAIADVLHGRDDAIEAAGLIIGGYVSVTPLEDEEAGLLADLVAARLATEVTVTAWRRGLYPDNTAYAASGEPGARAFLDAIEAVG
jgi:Ser/Thr protein kinase RdoA (MazF antagonist)